MRLNTEKNIDREVHLPSNLEFRAEKVWSKIESKDSKRSKFPWLFVSLATVVASLVLFIWTPKTEEIQINDKILVTGLTRVPAEPKLDLSRLLPVKQEKPTEKAKVSSDKKEAKELDLPDLEKSKLLFVTIAESIPEIPKEPLKSIKSEENLAPKSLSPAALLLKKNLTNTNRELIANQILIQEKFKLKNELAILALDKSSSNATGTVFESLKKKSYAKN